MKKLIQRLLMFTIGLPLIVCIVLFLPQYKHLALNILAVLFSALGAGELSVLLRQKNISIPKTEAMILGALSPAATTLIISFSFPPVVIPAFLTAGAAWLLLSMVFSGNREFDAFISRFAAGLAVLIYPGLFIDWIIRMSGWDRAEIILVFLCTVFANDSAAWAAGMLFGKKNRGIIPVSPNKSIAGFAGGTAASVLVCAGAALLWPDIFALQRRLFMPQAVCAGLLGLFSSIAASLGDLGESAIKRSSGIKDSGSIIPGRGGVLDSIDSISLAAPVFYLLFSLFFRRA